ncbi:hypothetical protein BWO91_17650 [Plantibacter flavus]|nr:hypothetical protein BWO91_17650 [Plantibacter flavus]
MRDIEATPAFIALGVDRSQWFWLWEKTEGNLLTFTTDGSQASYGAKLDMGRVPPVIEPEEPQGPWSCFSDVPAPPGVEYVLPPAPASFTGSAIVGQPLTITLGDLVKDSEWQTALMSPDTPLVLDGPAADGSFTWTPDAPGEYTFDYHLGTPNCVLGALTGSIHVAAPAITIDVPTRAPTDPLVAPSQPAALAETGVSQSRWHLLIGGPLALFFLGALALVVHRRNTRDIDPERLR